MKIVLISIYILLLLAGQDVQAQTDTITYHLSIDQKKVNLAGKQVNGMTINNSIPGPTLQFTEGNYAVIYVQNNMNEETSIHWHGLLLPNFMDGVPYLTTPPIRAGKTLKYEFPIKQSGTYWYHSHTLLQEQSGVFGSIVIQPKVKILDYDRELVLVLSDWTNEKPLEVLRTLKRRTEWYNIKKGTATPLNQVIARGAFGAQLNFWKQRMEGADIADIYYPAFLINGKQMQEYPNFKAGEKVRVRFINGAASTSFWLNFGGSDPTLVSADGMDVVPVKHNKTFIAVAETYDFIVTIPDDGKLEIRGTAQDGSGKATAFLGTGKIVAAPDIPRPDKIGMMMKMAKMKMRMGAPAIKFRPKKDEPYKMKENWGMKMEGKMNMPENAGNKKDEMGMMGMDHSKMPMHNDSLHHANMKMDKKMPKDSMKQTGMDHSKMTEMQANTEMPMKMNGAKKMSDMQGMKLFSEYNYDYLKSPEKTNYDTGTAVTKILLNLTGNMQRYIWSMNGIPLSETDIIQINGKGVTRITLNNLTMMHHPMHLHGHFFRVLNKNGDYSPLKHTVNVPPMQQVTIEFYGDGYGDWFFHCHILYHLMGGMARVLSYGTPRNPALEPYPVSTLIKETNKYYSWGMADVASSMSSVRLVSSNIRNQFNFKTEYGYNQNLETEFTYERYLYDYFRVFGGVNIENTVSKSLNNFKTTAVIWLRYLTPYLFNLDLRIDNELRPRISLGRAIMLFPKFSAFGYYEYQLDVGWVNKLPKSVNFRKEIVWSAGVNYLLSKNFSLLGTYDNRFGGGGGLSIRF